MSSKSVHEIFAKDLNDPEFVAFYLEECLNDSTDLFFKALGDVARANGMTEMASKTGRTREALYRSLSEAGNPEFRTVHSALDALGLQLTVAVKERGVTPNYAMLNAMREAEEIERGIVPKAGGDSVALVREARAGGMYGNKESE
jgi:probable addiction module antidote protein